MRRGIKILWVVIGCIFVVGIIFAGIGFGFGATGNAWFDREGLHFGSPQLNAVEQADDNTAPFNNVDVQLLSADVEVVPADNYGYDFSYYGRNEPTIEVKDGTLSVVEHDYSWHIDLMGFWDLMNQRSLLKVYVPRSATLNNVSLSTASGNASLNGNQLNIKNLSCKSASGNLDITGLTLDQLNVDIASGDVTLSDVSAATSNINLLSGWLKCKGTSFDALVLSMTSGNVNFEGEVQELLQLHMISGDAQILLVGSQDDFSFDFHKISGDIRVNGNRVDGNSTWPSSGSSTSSTGRGGQISVDITSGSVILNFKN